MTDASQHLTLSGAPEGHDASLLARELARGAPVIHVARDDRRMEAMRAALAFFAPDAVVLTFPAWDCLPYDRVSPNAAISATRMATLAALAAWRSRPLRRADHDQCRDPAAAGAGSAARGRVQRHGRRPGQ